MRKEVVLLTVEDDDGHFWLIRRNLQREGIPNKIVRFADGQEVLDYLFRLGDGEQREGHTAYLMLLDIRMPKVNGIEVLRQIKDDENLRKIPIVMLTTTDDQAEIDKSHKLGCSLYIVKPIEYADFVDTVRKLARFLAIVEIPEIV
ncbi:MAG: response regulator [Planctomycetes bacterium]|nr:response regulator [Planctomycetota bacterium]